MSVGEDSKADLSFGCDACGSTCAFPQAAVPEWVQITAFDCSSIHLCETLDDKTFRAAQEEPARIAGLCRLEQAPTLGHFIAHVRHPFAAMARVPFWFLFMSPMSQQHGWHKHTDEIYRSCLVRSFLEGIIHREEKYALIELTVEEVLPLPLLHEHFPEFRSNSSFTLFTQDVMKDAMYSRWLNYLYIDGRFVGDGEERYLLRQDNLLSSKPISRIILQGRRGPHEAFLWAGNRPLSPSESDLLQAFLFK